MSVGQRVFGVCVLICMVLALYAAFQMELDPELQKRADHEKMLQEKILKTLKTVDVGDMLIIKNIKTPFPLIFIVSKELDDDLIVGHVPGGSDERMGVWKFAFMNSDFAIECDIGVIVKSDVQDALSAMYESAESFRKK